MTANAFLILVFSSVLVTVSCASPWESYVHMLKPSFTQEAIDFIAPNVDTISFDLYTRDNPVNGTTLVLNNAKSVQASHWNMNKSTVIIIHGWNSNGSAEINTYIRDAYLQVLDVNVIVVDWGKIAKNLVYSTVVAKVPDVAEHVGTFINFLRTNAGLSFGDLKIIGHSLGAHIAGLAARSVQQYGLVNALVGLDPAKPLFELAGPDHRIDRSQAKYVEIVHTCAGTLGLREPLGTSDFYANDGRNQPGCGEDVLGGCAHERSYLYFCESIKHPKGFPGLRDCDESLAYMGGAALDRNAKGTYHFNTTGTAPYIVNEENL